MPNRVYAFVSFIKLTQSNTIVGYGKRFLAYNMMEWLQAQSKPNFIPGNFLPSDVLAR